MKILSFPVAWVILTSCQSPVEQPKFCGETFCLRSVAPEQVTKTTPVEDFNIYKISHQEREYSIYEGDNPQPPGRFVRSIKSSYPANNVRMFRGNGVLEVRFDQGPRTRPFAIGETRQVQFLVLWTRCADDQECGIEDFARLVVPHPGQPNP